MSGEEARARLALLGHHLLDFWVNICLCHSLIVEEAEDGGLPIYQARQAWPPLNGQSHAGKTLHKAWAGALLQQH